MWAGIHGEEEGGEGRYLLAERGGEAEGVEVEVPEAPIGRFEDQAEHQVDCDRGVAVVVAGDGGCHWGKEADGGCTWAEVRRGDAIRREAAVPGHDREIPEEVGHEHAEVYGILLDVALVQLGDRQAAVDCGDHVCQIRERPRTMAT